MSRAWLPVWLRDYRRADLPTDLVAGAVVAVMLVPQAMAYALLAGLPPAVGLYSAAAAVLIYPLFGSSRHLAVGPVAIVSLLVATGIGSLSPSGPAEYLGYAIQLALLVGIIQLGIGLARLGFLVHFISHAVIAGFTAAAALTIALSQVKLLLGVTVPRAENFFRLARSLFHELPNTSLPTVALGASSIAVLLFFGSALGVALRRTGIPERWVVPLTKSAPLVAVALSATAVALLGWGVDARVTVIGSIPPGLPKLSLPGVSVESWSRLLMPALAISFVGFAESYAVAKSLASKRRERVRANRELVALGAANFAASCVGGYPVTGGFSRSVVNFTAGARSGAASLVTGGLLLVTLAWLTPLFHSVPHAVLAAIIVVAVAKLIDLRSFAELWRYSRADGTAYLATFLGVLVAGVEAGIVVGAAIALGLHLWRTSRPHIAVVGRVGETEHYRNILRHEVQTDPGVLAIRVDESLYFANTAYLEERILGMVAERPRVRDLVLITSAVNFIDGGALDTLQHLIAELRDGGVTLHLAEVKGPVMDRLQLAGFREKLSPGRVFLTTHQALQSLRSPPPGPEAGIEVTARRWSSTYPGG